MQQVIEAVMGWLDCHLHEFEVAGERYGIPDPDYDYDEPIRSEQRVRLVTALGDTHSFRYIYDFGDNWEHRVNVERRLPPEPLFNTALCIAGANAAPPDDVGGEPGYVDLVVVMTDPNHPEHQDMLAWHSRPFDRTALDITAVDLRLNSIKL